ncbi:hypothetical protein GW17_00012093 [Ensete ventricosum]|nr:hypothetical protein GW17_00012093 [Ensete ventricosum]
MSNFARCKWRRIDTAAHRSSIEGGLLEAKGTTSAGVSYRHKYVDWKIQCNGLGMWPRKCHYSSRLMRQRGPGSRRWGEGQNSTVTHCSRARNTPVRRDELSFDSEEGAVGSEEQMARVGRRRKAEGESSGCNVKQRKGSNRVDVLERLLRQERKKGWSTVVAGAIEMANGKGQRLLWQRQGLRRGQRAEEQQRVEKRWAAEAQRWLCAAVLLGRSQQKKKRKQSNGYSVSIDVIGSDDCRRPKEEAT